MAELFYGKELFGKHLKIFCDLVQYREFLLGFLLNNNFFTYFFCQIIYQSPVIWWTINSLLNAFSSGVLIDFTFLYATFTA